MSQQVHPNVKMGNAHEKLKQTKAKQKVTNICNNLIQVSKTGFRRT